jgi:hypothetical protein
VQTTCGRATLRLVPEAAPTLARLEDQIGAVLDAHRDELAHTIAVALVEVAAAAHVAQNGNGRIDAPRLCRVCKARLAASARTVCNACRRRDQRARERLRQEHIDGELEAAARGERGVRAQGFARGERTGVEPARREQLDGAVG